MKVHIGIDIGGKGAVAIFKNDTLFKYFAFPLSEGVPDIRAFVELVLIEVENADRAHVVIEDLHSVFGAGANSNFQFGWINGAVETTLICLSIPFTKVGPKKWQKEMWEGVRPVLIPSFEKKKKGVSAVQKRNKDGSPKYKTDTKATSLLAAKRLFPNENFLATARSKVPHDGIVDAILMGEYCRRHF